MMDNEEQFFNGIEDTLHAYEEAYVPGAWEAFQQKRKRRRMAVLFFRIGSAAAVLLLFSYVAIQFFADAPKPVQVAQTKVDPRQPKVIQSQPEVKITQPAIQQHPNNSLAEKNIANNKSAPVKVPAYQEQITKPFTQNAPALNPVITQQDNVVAAVTDAPGKNNKANQPTQSHAVPDSISAGKPGTDILAGAAVIQNQPKKAPAVTRSIYDSLVNNKINRPVAEVVKKNGKNLTYSVVVSPALGNQKVNFGTGVEVAYNLTDNLSINSGIAYSSLNASSAGNNSPMTNSSKQVQGVNLQVSGFEVPIGLQYRTGGGYYVSAGIVGMSVMSNNLRYDYIAQNTVATASYMATYSSVAGMKQEVLRVSTEQKTEEVKEKVKNVLGFYMLSVGKKKAVGNGNSQLNFGPFLRIPFGAVSSENIRLMQGGVRLGFDF